MRTIKPDKTMSKPAGSPINILIVDFVSEKNRGDAAINVGLINLINKGYTNANISVISVFGANQFPKMEQEHDHSSMLGIQIFGGLVPTFYPTPNQNKKHVLLFEIHNFISLFFRLWLLIALKLGVPAHFIKRFFSKRYLQTFMLFVDADLIVIRGRNYRNRKTAALEIIRMLSKIYHLILCQNLSKKIVLIGASVWDQKSNLAEKILGHALKSCKFFTVRESNSFKTAKRIANTYKFPEPILIPDLSFAAFNNRKEIIQNRRKLSQRRHPEIIGLTIHDWDGESRVSKKRYFESIVGLVQYYENLHSRIFIIPQVTVSWEYNMDMLYLLQTKTESKYLEIVPGQPTVNELLHFYSKLDLLVATRMHSAIFAAAVNTPFVAIPYDRGGKWNIIEELGYGKYMLNFDQITPKLLIDKTVECWHKKESLIKNAEKIVDDHTEHLQLLIDLLKTLP